MKRVVKPKRKRPVFKFLPEAGWACLERLIFHAGAQKMNPITNPKNPSVFPAYLMILSPSFPHLMSPSSLKKPYISSFTWRLDLSMVAVS
jgi:hypothetical protein